MNERERIELLMKSYGMTPSQFADRTGIQRASVSHIISGRNKPSLEVLQKIYEAFPELDIKWLKVCRGMIPMRIFSFRRSPVRSLRLLLLQSLNRLCRNQRRRLQNLYNARYLLPRSVCSLLWNEK